MTTDTATKTHHCGWVALMGPPNAGKSTLLNAMLGQKLSIVTPKPQTTRNQIVGILTDNESQIIFMDMPGLHHSRSQMRGQLGKVMREAIYQSIGRADLALLVLDSHLYINKPEFLERDLAPFAEVMKSDKKHLIIILNKVDLFHDKGRMLPLISKLNEVFDGPEIFPMSALEKDGVKLLKKMILEHMPEGPAIYDKDQISTAPIRFLSAELIREKVFERLHQEVPYSTAVEIEAWEEDTTRNLTIIHAAIYVARPSHKAMVIGKQGSTIKEIGTLARQDIQELIGTKVHLELWVKVREDWLEDPSFLHEYQDYMPG